MQCKTYGTHMLLFDLGPFLKLPGLIKKHDIDSKAIRALFKRCIRIESPRESLVKDFLLAASVDKTLFDDGLRYESSCESHPHGRDLRSGVEGDFRGGEGHEEWDHVEETGHW